MKRSPRRLSSGRLWFSAGLTRRHSWSPNTHVGRYGVRECNRDIDLQGGGRCRPPEWARQGPRLPRIAKAGGVRLAPRRRSVLALTVSLALRDTAHFAPGRCARHPASLWTGRSGRSPKFRRRTRRSFYPAAFSEGFSPSDDENWTGRPELHSTARRCREGGRPTCCPASSTTESHPSAHCSSPGVQRQMRHASTCVWQWP